MKVWALTKGPVSEGKYLVVRRDGTIPPWPHFVIAASDPAAPSALAAYAHTARVHGFAEDYCASVRELADVFEEWRTQNEETAGKRADPDKGPHRLDNPAVVRLMRGEGDLSSLGRETSEEIAEIAARLMNHPDAEVRRVAASALGQRAA